MNKIISIVSLLICSTLCLAADPEEHFREVETLCRHGKVNEGRKILLSIQVPANRIDLLFRKVELDINTRLFIGVNLQHLIDSQQDQDAPLTWGLKIMKAGWPQCNTNEALSVYTAFTNRFTGTPGITNTYFWRQAIYASQEIQEGKSQAIKQTEPITPSTNQSSK